MHRFLDLHSLRKTVQEEAGLGPQGVIPAGALGVPAKVPRPKPLVHRDSIDALKDEEVRQLIEWCQTHDAEYREQRGIPLLLLIQGYLRAGWHVSVITRPDLHRLELGRRTDGLAELRWNRPKKHGVPSWTRIVVPEAQVNDWTDLLQWLQEFPRSKRWHQNLVEEIGRAAGLNRELATLALRHTGISGFVRKLGPFAGARLGNITLKVAMDHYMHGSEHDIDRQLAFLPDAWTAKNPGKSGVCPTCGRPGWVEPVPGTIGT
jgi:hypothetical protein